MQFLNILVVSVWIPKGKRQKLKWEKGLKSLCPLKVTLTKGGWTCNKGETCNNSLPLLSAPLVVRSRSQWSEHIFGGQSPFVYVWVKDATSFFCMWIFIYPSIICWKIILSPLNCFGTFVENELIMNMKVYFYTLI